MSAKNLLIVGLPESGKTTFLAALWAVLNHGDAPGHYELGTLDGDVAYLHRIRDLWLSCKKTDRTLPSDERELKIPLKIKNSASSFTICVPELAGETFAKAWETRTISTKLSEAIVAADGIVLFVSSEKIQKPIRMDQTRVAIAGLISSDPPNRAEPVSATAAEVPNEMKPAGETRKWKAEMAPTQVMLVDILQFIEGLRPIKNLSLVVSAWDTVKLQNGHGSPSEWIQREMPLLSQYLYAGTDSMEVRYFGMSAQGGSYLTESDRLLELSPQLRPKVFDGNGLELEDVMAPIKWLPI